MAERNGFETVTYPFKEGYVEADFFPVAFVAPQGGMREGKRLKCLRFYRGLDSHERVSDEAFRVVGRRRYAYGEWEADDNSGYVVSRFTEGLVVVEAADGVLVDVLFLTPSGLFSPVSTELWGSLMQRAAELHGLRLPELEAGEGLSDGEFAVPVAVLGQPKPAQTEVRDRSGRRREQPRGGRGDGEQGRDTSRSSKRRGSPEEQNYQLREAMLEAAESQRKGRPLH